MISLFIGEETDLETQTSMPFLLERTWPGSVCCYSFVLNTFTGSSAGRQHGDNGREQDPVSPIFMELSV